MLVAKPENLMHSVRTDQPISRRPAFSLVCSHKRLTGYVDCDYTEGPGWMGDAYEGLVCVVCGKIISRTQTY